MSTGDEGAEFELAVYEFASADSPSSDVKEDASDVETASTSSPSGGTTQMMVCVDGRGRPGMTATTLGSSFLWRGLGAVVKRVRRVAIEVFRIVKMETV